MPAIVDSHGREVPQGFGGWLVINKPWPGMLRGIWGDESRYREQYWSKVPHRYLAGDNARQDQDGYYWIMGRIDDVLNVAGHRLSTIEIESALVSHPLVAEAAAVGRPDEIKGEAVAVFVTLKSGEPSEELRQGVEEARSPRDWRPGPAGRSPVHDCSAQDAQRQDYASVAEGHCRRQRDHRRHDHARGLQRFGQTASDDE